MDLFEIRLLHVKGDDCDNERVRYLGKNLHIFDANDIVMTASHMTTFDLLALQLRC
jgi:hypothetical protein